MDTSSSTRFRFRDHQEMEDTSESDSSSDISSVSSDGDEDAEPESMTGKGIKRLCSELVELKTAADEDFYQNIFSNYSAFVRIFEEVGGVENELMQLRNHVSTQKRLVKDLTDRIYLKVLSGDTFDSIIEEPGCDEPSILSELEVHANDVLEILDTLLSEHRLDEALDILEMEVVMLHSIQLEETFPPDVLTSYKSAMSERKALLEMQLVLMAENPRVPTPELRKALVGLCRLGDGRLATQLLLKYYRSRLATGIHHLQCSKSILHGVYIRDLSKFVFSMISQAAKSFVMLYGESSPHASELISWACEETETFAACFNKHVKSISEISGGLSSAVDAVQCAMSFCCLLEAQKLVLRPCLIKHIRPCMEEVLQIHINHFKKVIGIFTAIDSWVLGRYLVTGILVAGYSSIVIGEQPEYCLLTNSGRKFVTLLQAITEDISPLWTAQMEGSILKGIKDLFMEYIVILEKAITVVKGSSGINLAESLPQQISILASTSTLAHFYSSIISRIFNSDHFSGDLNKNQPGSIDIYMLQIEGSFSKLRAHFCQRLIHKIVSVKDGWRDSLESFDEDEGDSKILHDMMPSAVFQELFSELRELDQYAEDNVVEVDWLRDILQEMMKAIFFWISNDKEFWTSIDESLSAQRSGDFKQFVLDMHFLVEVARYGGYLSQDIEDSSLRLVFRMESAFLSAELDLKRDVNDNEWAKNAATAAIQKLLLTIEQTNLSRDHEPIDILEEEPYECQPEYASDSFQEDATSYSDDEPDEDIIAITASEVTHKGSSDVLEDEGGFNDRSAITNSFEESKDLGTENAASTLTSELQDNEETEITATLPFQDINEEALETSVTIGENSNGKHDSSDSTSGEIGEDCAEIQGQDERNNPDDLEYNNHVESRGENIGHPKIDEDNPEIK